MAKVRLLPVSIMEDKAIGNCSNNGISARFKEILLIHPQGTVVHDTDDLPENACKVVTRLLRSGEVYRHVEPVRATDKGCVGWMAGGSCVDSPDTRFREISGGYPLRLHDRQETREYYNSMD